MQTLRRILLFLAAASSALAAEPALEQVRRARDLLGDDVWTQTLRIENETRWGRHPRRVHALVFELAGILWIYLPHDGTQGFSRWKDRLAEEKADFGPLLRDIDPGFTRWEVLPDEPASFDPRAPLPNGCFIESVAALRERRFLGGEAERPGLLSYYVDAATHRRGHTVLTYRTAEGLEVIDPAQIETRRQPWRLDPELSAHPLELARALDKRAAKAHLIPVELPVAPRLDGNRLAGGSAMNEHEIATAARTTCAR